MQKTISLGLLLSVAGLAQSGVARLRLGPLHQLEQPGSIEILVELPRGVSVQPADFQLLEDGKATVRAAAVKPFRTSGWPLAMVVALDSSRSIKKQVLEEVKQAAAGFVTEIRDPVALVTFADRPEGVPFGTPRQELIARISMLRPTGHQTGLYAALDTALALFGGRKEPEQRRIVVVSDGSEESRAEPDSVDAALARARQHHVAIDTIWIVTSVAGARNTMVRMSERTGGVHSDARNSAEILVGFRRVLQRVDQSLVVSFNRRVEPNGPMTREVGITVNRPDIASATAALQIPVTAPERAAGIGSLQILLWIAGILVGLYLLYALIYVLVTAYSPDKAGLFPFPPWPRKKPPVGVIPDMPPVVPPPQPPPPPPRPRAHTVVAPRNPLVLEVLRGPFEGQRLQISRTLYRIGADSESQLNLGRDDYVSSRHAVIRYSGEQWILVDEDSMNGTFVNGHKLSAGAGHILRDGESIRIGRSEFRVILEGDVRVAQASVESEPR